MCSIIATSINIVNVIDKEVYTTTFVCFEDFSSKQKNKTKKIPDPHTKKRERFPIDMVRLHFLPTPKTDPKLTLIVPSSNPMPNSHIPLEKITTGCNS